jgi:hypothetical protein
MPNRHFDPLIAVGITFIAIWITVRSLRAFLFWGIALIIVGVVRSARKK